MSDLQELKEKWGEVVENTIQPLAEEVVRNPKSWKNDKGRFEQKLTNYSLVYEEIFDSVLFFHDRYLDLHRISIILSEDILYEKRSAFEKKIDDDFKYEYILSEISDKLYEIEDKLCGYSLEERKVMLKEKFELEMAMSKVKKGLHELEEKPEQSRRYTEEFELEGICDRISRIEEREDVWEKSEKKKRSDDSSRPTISILLGTYSHETATITLYLNAIMDHVREQDTNFYYSSNEDEFMKNVYEYISVVLMHEMFHAVHHSLCHSRIFDSDGQFDIIIESLASAFEYYFNELFFSNEYIDKDLEEKRKQSILVCPYSGWKEIVKYYKNISKNKQRKIMDFFNMSGNSIRCNPYFIHFDYFIHFEELFDGINNLNSVHALGIKDYLELSSENPEIAQDRLLIQCFR